MRRGLPKINKLLALILALVLFASSSVGVYAEGDGFDASGGNFFVDNSSTDSKETASGENEDNDAEDELKDEAEGQGETDKEAASEDEKDSGDDKEAGKDAKDDADADDSADEDSKDDADPEVAEDEDKSDEDGEASDKKDTVAHEDSHKVKYKAASDGKHKVICDDEECEKYGETITEEDCEYGEDGQCKKCDSYNASKHMLSLETEFDGISFKTSFSADTFETEDTAKIKLVVTDVSESVREFIKYNIDSLGVAGDQFKYKSYDIRFEIDGETVNPKSEVKISASGFDFTPATVVHLGKDNIGRILSKTSEWTVVKEKDDDNAAVIWFKSKLFSPFIFVSAGNETEVLDDGVLYGESPEAKTSPYGFGGTDEKHLDRVFALEDLKKYVKENPDNKYYAVRILSHNTSDEKYQVIAPYSSDVNSYFVYDSSEVTEGTIKLRLQAPENYEIKKVYLKKDEIGIKNQDGGYTIPLQEMTEEDVVNDIVINLGQDAVQWDDSVEDKYTTISGATLVNYKDFEHVDGRNYNRNFGDDFHFNNGDERQPYSNFCNYGLVYQGLASNSYDLENDVFTLKNGHNDLFTEGSDNISAYRENVDVQFQKDTDGYWTIDSSKFEYQIVENDNQYVLKPEGGNESFRPFGTDVNHFGMILPLEFTVDGEGKNGNGDDTIFSFTGDDDVFVYIDGKLVLDLGGIHDAISGQINFNTGDVLIQGDYDSKLTSSVDGSVFFNTGSSSTLKATNLYNIVGEKKYFVRNKHTLTVVYFERGENLSNCRISYNFNPINFVPDPGKLNIVKTLENFQDEYGTAVSVFEVQYTDKAGKLHSNVYSYDFNESGTLDSIIVEFPADTEVTVFETYAGASYKLKSVATEDGVVNDDKAVVTVKEGETATVEFVNTYDGRTNYGTISVINVIKKNLEDKFEIIKNSLEKIIG